MNSILIKNLYKQYANNERVILNKVNLEFKEGMIYAILGKSGSGKTTLLNIISGLDGEYKGNVLINGLDLKDILDIDKKSYLRNCISYIHQSSTCFEKMSILDNVSLPYITTERPNITLSDFCLPYKVDRKVNKLSKGEQKRINIIQNLYKKSSIMLLDEPTAGLDEKNANLVMSKIASLKEKKIIIIVTHNKEIAETYADEIIELKDGFINKNYTKKIKTDEFKIQGINKLTNNIAKRCASKFVTSEKTNNNLILSSTIVSLVCLGLISSLLFGIRKIFKDQINNTDDQTNITFETINSISNLNEDEYNSLKTEFPSDNIFYYYKSNQLVNCSLNYIEFNMDSSFIDYPNKYCENLNEDEIIISTSQNFIDNIEDYLECEDIEDYMLFNDLYFSFTFNTNLFTYKVKEFFTIAEEDFYINSSNRDLYKSFHNQDEIKYVGFDSTNISNVFKNYIESTTTYSINKEQSLINISKFDNQIIDFKLLQQKYNNILPLYTNSDLFWINYFQGVLYFNNCSFKCLDKEIEQTIFFNPYYENIKIGRKVENDDEIIISYKLYKLLNIKQIQNYIDITFNNQTKSYKIVGVSDDESTLNIYQDFSWASNEFLKIYCLDKYLFKPYSFLLTTEPQNITSLESQLNQSFPNYQTSSYVGETLKTLDKITSKIVYISLCIIFLLSIISLFSIITLFNLEKDEYKDQINIFKGFGYDNNDLNKIYLHIYIRRSLISSIIGCISTFTIAYLIDYIFKELDIFDSLMLKSIYPYLFIILLSMLIYIMGFLVCKFRNKKASVISEA